jgi:MarR family transcriptional regulator, organic hydroperoxide resistance regulator
LLRSSLRDKSKKEPAAAAKRYDAAKTSKTALPPTVSRRELLNDGTDRDFRRMVHNIFAFTARHEAIRDGLARHIGLAGIDYTILISIGHLGLGGDVNVKTVADHLHMSSAFVTTVTSKLQHRGLIEKTQDSSDRRRISLAITEKAKMLLRRLAPYQREINDVEFAPLSKEQFRLLTRILESLLEASDNAMALQQYRFASKNHSNVA